MKTFKVYYSFNGQGECFITAKDQKEAEQMFYDGDYSVLTEKESGSEYEIMNVEPIKK